MVEMSPPSWLQPLDEQVDRALATGRLPHAWLVSGQAGLGKRGWAERTRRKLLCRQGQGCGRCDACRLLDAGSHPDSFTVEPDGRWIKVEAIRRLIHFSGLSASQGGRKVCLIQQADRMNLSAANALLKTLEEPPADTVFILLADDAGRLPATIRSRCRFDAVPWPDPQQAQAWLSRCSEDGVQCHHALLLAGGNPGRARAWLQQQRMPALLAFVAAVGGLWQRPQDLQRALDAAAEVGVGEALELSWCIVAECIKIAAGLRNEDDRLPGLPHALPAETARRLYPLLFEARAYRDMLGTGVDETGLMTDWLLNWIKVGRR